MPRHPLIAGRRNPVHSGLLATLGCLFLLAGLSSGAEGQTVPRLEEVDRCPGADEVGYGPEVRCGWLIVPERYDTPGSPELRLAWAVAGASTKAPQSDPVVFIQGGPGLGVLEYISRRFSSGPWAEVRNIRELIFLDVRGTGFSEPHLCPPLDELLSGHNLLTTPRGAFDVRMAKLAAECARAGPFDPGAYNSPNVARDFDTLRSLLGYDQWNIWGLSYGGRYAQTIMRDFPQTVRAAILDSPASLGQQGLRTVALREAFDAVFDNCTAQPDCAAAYPDLANRFDSLLLRLERSPIAMPTDVPFADPWALEAGQHRPVDRRTLLRRLQSMLLRDARIVPFVIHELDAGRNHALVLLGREAGPLWRGQGVALAIHCFDDARNTPEYLAALRDRYAILEIGGWFDARIDLLCPSYHSDRASAEQWAPADTGIPTLVLGGAHDSTVPPSMIRHAAQVESGATLVMVESGGHGLAGDIECVDALLVDFVNEPGPVDAAACIEANHWIPFVTDVRPVPGALSFNTSLALQPGEEVRPRWILLNLWVLLSTLILLLASPIWGVAALWGRVRRDSTRATGSAWPTAPIWLASLTSVLGVCFIVGYGAAMSAAAAAYPALPYVGVPGAYAPLFLLPKLLIPLTAAVVVGSLLAFRLGWWSRIMRAHYALVAIASISLTAFIWFWPLI